MSYPKDQTEGQFAWSQKNMSLEEQKRQDQKEESKDTHLFKKNPAEAYQQNFSSNLMFGDNQQNQPQDQINFNNNDHNMEYRTSINNRISDPAEPGIDSQRVKKKSKFNTEQQLQQQQHMQHQQLNNLKSNRIKHLSLFKILKTSRATSNAFQYIDFSDKYHTWRDTHIDALECVVLFCESLLANQTLQQLNVSGIQYCDILMEELCETLSLMPSMKQLELNNLQLDCLSWRSVSKYVGSSKTLEKLSIQNNNIQEECIRDVLNCFRNPNNLLQDVNISQCTIDQISVNILLRLLSNNHHIKNVNLSNGTLTDENAEGVAEFLSNCKKIQLLDISNNNLSYSFLLRLNTHLRTSTFNKTKIHSFDIGSNAINTLLDESLIKQSQQGKHKNQKPIDSLIQILKKLKGVHKLNISNNFLETEDIRRLNQGSIESKGLVFEELDLSFNNIDRNFPENFFQNIKVLNLKKNLLSLSSMEVISRTLKEDQTKWEVLDISDNKINNGGVEILINYLKENTRLKELYLQNNEIEGVGMISIIINNERMNLNKIDLSENRFTLNSVISYLNSLKNQQLSKIVLRNFDEIMKANNKTNLINDSKIIFDQPFSLDLQKSSILASHIFKGFDRHLPKLSALYINYCNDLNEDDIRRLAFLISHSHTLTILSLEGINLGNLSNDSLENLSLAFGENRCLKELNLHKCNLGVKIRIVGREFGNINSLEELDLSENELNDVIGDVLRVIVQKCFHLIHLNLSNNLYLGQQCILSIIKGLKGNSSLKKLSLGSTAITSGELISIAHLLKDCKHLKSLDISQNKLLEVTTATVNTLQLKPNTLVIKGNKLPDLTEVNHLRILMEKNIFTKRVVLNYIESPSSIIGRLLEYVPSLSQLTMLCIKQPQFGIDSEKMSTLLSQLVNLSNLTKLQLIKIPLNVQHCEEIANIMKQSVAIRYLQIEEELLNLSKMAALSSGIQNNNSLVKLKLRDNGISSDEVQVLARSIQQHPNLQLINLSLNKIKNKGVQAITESLKNSKSMQSIIFSSQKENDYENARTLSHSLQQSLKNIRTLVLKNSRIRLEDLSAILTDLKNHPSLVNLDLSENSIPQVETFRLMNEGFEKIKNFLEQNNTLKQLLLRRCEIGVEGFGTISKGVCRNNILETLDLRENSDDGDECMEQFERYLHETHLKLLLVNGNKINAEGNQFLYRMVRSRQRLFVVNDWFEVTDELGIELFSHLIHIYNSGEQVKCLNMGIEEIYSHIDLSKGYLTDRFCLFLTENLIKLTGLQTLDLRQNENITQTGMKHVFTAVFDLRKDETLSLVSIQFSSSYQNFSNQQNDSNNLKDKRYPNLKDLKNPLQEQEERKQNPSTVSHNITELHHVGGSIASKPAKSLSSKNTALNPNSQNIIPAAATTTVNEFPEMNALQQKGASNIQQNNKKNEKLSIWAKFGLRFRRRAQFINEKLRWQLEYKFDYANLEKLQLENRQVYVAIFLSIMFILQFIVIIAPFFDISLIWLVLAINCALVMMELAFFMLYLYKIYSPDTDSQTFLQTVKYIVSQLKAYDFVLLTKGGFQRADFACTSLICVYYFDNNLTYLNTVYVIFLSVKLVVIVFYTSVPFIDWLRKRSSKAQIASDKQYLDISERYCMAIGMSLLEQIFALFNPGASATLEFGGKKKSSKSVINIWSKKVFEAVYLTFYLAPLIVLYILFYDQFTDLVQIRILYAGLGFSVMSFILSSISFVTTAPTFIQQADFNHVLNMRKFTIIEKNRSKNKAKTIRKTVTDNLKPQQRDFETPLFLPSSLRNTLLMKLAKDGVIVADIRQIPGKDQSQRNQDQEIVPLVTSQAPQDNDGPQELIIDPIESLQGSIPRELDNPEAGRRVANDNYFNNLRKFKNE